MLKHLKPLVMMQLKDKLDFGFMKSRRSLLFKIVLSVLGFALVTVIMYGIMYALVLAHIFSFVATLPVGVLSIVMTVMLLLSMLNCLIGLTRSLYLTSDNRVLLTFPVNYNLVFLSKVILYFIYELKRNVAFTLPLFIAFGIVNSYAWLYYVWLIPCFFLVSLLPVALAALLSIPALFISQIVKSFKWLQGLLFVTTLVLSTWGVFALIGLIPENINLIGSWGSIFYAIQDAIAAFNTFFLPFTWITELMAGVSSIKMFSIRTLWIMLSLIGVIAALLVAAFFAVKPLYFRMASKQFEFEKSNNVKPKKNVRRHKMISPLSEDVRMNFRDSKYFVKLFVKFITLPVAVFFLTKIFAAMNTRLTGQYMTIAFTYLIVLLILCASNSEFAAVFSRVGNARLVAKTRPIEPLVITISKLIVNAIVSTLSVILALSLYNGIVKLNLLHVSLIGLSSIFISLAHLLWSAELDIMHPQSEQYAMVGATYDNPNEKKSVMLAFVLSFLPAFVMYFLLSEGMQTAMIKLFLIGLVLLGARIYLFVTRVKLYYLEK